MTDEFQKGYKAGIDEAMIWIRLYPNGQEDEMDTVQDLVDDLLERMAHSFKAKPKPIVNLGALRPSGAIIASAAIAQATITVKPPVITSLKGKHVAFSGKLDYFTRDQAIAAARRAGAYARASVSSYTQVLVVGRRSGQKVNTAINRNVIIIDEKTFRTLV